MMKPATFKSISLKLNIYMTSMLLGVIGGFNYSASAFEATDLKSKHDWLFQCSNGKSVYIYTHFEDPVNVIEDTDFGVYPSRKGNRNCPVGWRRSVEPKFKFGQARIQFIGGSERERWAKVVPDEDDSENTVLDFSILKAYRDLQNSERKARVQLGIVGNRGIHNVYVKVRFKLDKDFSVLRAYPGDVKWMAITEWWNNGGWGDNPYPFSFAVHLTKASAIGAPLNLSVSARTFNQRTKSYSTVWSETNKAFSLPVGEWLTLEYHVVEGDNHSGRFTLNVTDKIGTRHNIFNVVNYTHHPNDPNPDGFQDIQPIKHYTSGKTADYFYKYDKKLVIYWDDLLIVGCKDTRRPCSGPSANRGGH